MQLTAGNARSCYVLELTPRSKSPLLIAGKVWVDAGSYAVVRIEGRFAASLSILVGAPSISEEFVQVDGFWLPGHVRSVTSSFLLGPTELNIRFSNYQAQMGIQLCGSEPRAAHSPWGTGAAGPAGDRKR